MQLGRDVTAGIIVGIVAIPLAIAFAIASGVTPDRGLWTAIREEGISCRAAARQFKVSYASAIRWAQAMRERGSFAPLTMGGDTRSRRVEAHADNLLRLHGLEPELTLTEIYARLERARGEKDWPSMIRRLLALRIDLPMAMPKAPANFRLRGLGLVGAEPH